MDGPDVLGLELTEALELLRSAGLTARVVATRPPRGGVGGPQRVLRVTRLEAGVVELVAAAQGWEEENGRPVQSLVGHRGRSGAARQQPTRGLS